MNGIGNYYFANGGSIYGNFRGGFPHGLTKIELQNQNIFYGAFVNGTFQGKGLTYLSATNTWSFGEFSNGEEIKKIAFGQGKPTNFRIAHF